VSSEIRVLLEGDQRNLASYQKVRQILADVEVVVVSLEYPADLFRPAGISVIRRVSEAFLGQPGVEDVKSLTHSSKPVRQGTSFQMAPLAPTGVASDTDLQKLRQFCLEHPLVRNVMVAGDARHTLITVTYRRALNTVVAQRALRAEVESVLAPFQSEGLRFHVLAVPLIEEEIRSALRRDIRWFAPAAAGLVVLILWLTFRSWPMVLLVLANQAGMFLLLPGLMALGGFKLNVFSVILLPLLGGLHLELMAHVCTGFQRALAQAAKADEALPLMLRTVFKPAAFATLTTVVGLLSLCASDVREVRDFGLLGAMGLAFIHLFTFGPTLALLKLVARAWPLRAAGTSGSVAQGELAWARWQSGVARARRSWILAAAGLAVLLALGGLRLIRTDIRAVEFLNRRSPTRQAMEELDRIYGGVNVVQIEFDSRRTNGVNNLDFLRYVERVHRFAETRADLSGAYSYPQLLAMMNQIWESERPGSFRLPDNPLTIGLFVLALQAYDYPFLTALADPTFRTAYLVLRTRDMPAKRYLALIEEVLTYAQNARPAGVTVSAAAGLHSILEADRRIIRSQLGSAGITVGVIALMLALLWRSAWLALLSVLTNAIAVAAVIAVAGYADVPLNSITVMVAAISLGIAVDDSIHFITYWREERHTGAAPEGAILNTLRAKGRPIISTSVILMAIFAVFWFSSFPPVVHFGLLSALAFAIALAAVLFFLPAILSFVGKPKSGARD
jgi:predicted RND superfamily exporter protein